MTQETTKRRSKKAPITVVEYLSQQITLSGKNQSEIAAEAEFPNANIISMIKRGITKLPMSKVGKMAKAINVDPAYLLRLCMQEYEPEVWEVIEQVMSNNPPITANEFEIIEILRAAKPGNPKVRTDVERNHLAKAFAELKAENF